VVADRAPPAALGAYFAARVVVVAPPAMAPAGTARADGDHDATFPDTLRVVPTTANTSKDGLVRVFKKNIPHISL